ncbi:MAG TPA: hypothetical protein PLK90_09285 [Clostridiales bacterium]|nr:hypothetical protein [Clostridiales bacterium]HQP70579.1 hypothetical protein [Clostridiales bacterium]
MKNRLVIYTLRISLLVFVFQNNIFSQSINYVDIEKQIDLKTDSLPTSYHRDKSFPVKTIKTENREITYYRNLSGDIADLSGGIWLESYQIITDKEGKQLALDRHFHPTGLTIDEYIIHQEMYYNRIYEILNEKGISKDSAVGSYIMWHDNRLNLDKLEELKENGFDPLPKGGVGIGGGILSSAFLSETVIIGEVIQKKEVDMNNISLKYYNELKIAVSEVIKGACKDTITCVEYDQKIPMNKKILITLDHPAGYGYNHFLLGVFDWYEINDEMVTEPSTSIVRVKRSIPYEEYKLKLKKLLEINDTDNFYKKTWIKD